MQNITFLSMTVEELRSVIADTVRETIANHPQPASEARMETDELLTREDAARELHVAMMTLRSYELRGILKPLRIGRRVLYSRRDIRAVLAGGTSSASTSTRSSSPRNPGR